MNRNKEWLAPVGCWTVILLIIGIPTLVCGIGNRSSVPERHVPTKIQNCSKNFIYISGTGLDVAVNSGQLTIDRESSDSSFHLMIHRGYFWCNEYVFCIRRKQPIARVFMHEVNRYTVVFDNENTLDSLEIYGATLVADISEEEPMYLEIDSKLDIKIHVHSASELDGGMWRQHRNKRPDRTGTTSVIE